MAFTADSCGAYGNIAGDCRANPAYAWEAYEVLDCSENKKKS